jgi:hypothetical protein
MRVPTHSSQASDVQPVVTPVSPTAAGVERLLGGIDASEGTSKRVRAHLCDVCFVV